MFSMTNGQRKFLLGVQLSFYLILFTFYPMYNGRSDKLDAVIVFCVGLSIWSYFHNKDEDDNDDGDDDEGDYIPVKEKF